MTVFNMIGFITKGTRSNIYNISDDSYEYSYTGVTKAEYDNYIQSLKDNELSQYAVNTIGANHYATYVSEKYGKQVNVAYYANTNTAKVIVSKLGYLPSSVGTQINSPKTETLAQLAINKIKNEADNTYYGGMIYVAQLQDGSFVIIDSGERFDENREALLSYLETNNAGTGFAKPQVTWIFTHGHADHVGLAIQILATEEYRNRIDINLIAYNFLNEDTYGDFYWDIDTDDTKLGVHGPAKSTIANFEAAVEACGATVYKYHSGDVLTIANCKIEFLVTHEDIYPYPFFDVNGSGTVFKMTFASGKSFLVLGDATEVTADFLLDNYDDDTLAVDVIQVAHHGTSSDEKADEYKNDTTNVFNNYRPQLYKKVSDLGCSVALCPNLSTNKNLGGSYNTAMNSYLTATWYFHDDTYVVNMSTLAVAKFN